MVLPPQTKLAHHQNSLGWVKGCEADTFERGGLCSTVNLEVVSGHSVGDRVVSENQDTVAFGKVKVLDGILTLAQDESVSTGVSVGDVVSLVGTDEVITETTPKNIGTLATE